jgi:hypothetical protein
MTKDDLRALSDEQLRALSHDEFWHAVEPEGVCPSCDDPRLVAEAKRRNEATQMARRWFTWSRIAVEECLPDTFSIGQLLNARMYAEANPEQFTPESLKEMHDYVRERSPKSWRRVMDDLAPYGRNWIGV